MHGAISAFLRAGRSLHSKDGAVGRRILAGTVSGTRARVGLGVCIRVGVSDGCGLGKRWESGSVLALVSVSGTSYS
jgi:hypothetical protein